MSTRCNVVIKETEGKFFQLYHHCDGYPDGVGLELEDYLKQMSPTCLSRGEDVVDFICGSDDYYEYEGPEVSLHGDIEYLYIIDLSKNTIVCYSTWLTGAENIDELIINDKIGEESNEATFVYMTKFKSEVSEEPEPVTDTPVTTSSTRTVEKAWHDASEEPQGAYIILCDGLDHIQWILDYTDMSHIHWKDYAKSRDVARWAYISDLLPKGGEK